MAIGCSRPSSRGGGGVIEEENNYENGHRSNKKKEFVMFSETVGSVYKHICNAQSETVHTMRI
jgi:hypothetical protein